MLEKRSPAALERIFAARWPVVLSVAIPAIVLFALNLYICRDLFRNQTTYTNSMHGFWAAIATRAGKSWFKPEWWPLWDNGIPFEFTYQPLIPALMALMSRAAGIPPLMAFQWVSAWVYCLAPITLFFFAWAFTRRTGTSFAAALLYSLTSVSLLIVPDADFSLKHFWDARRLYLITVWDDTPHLAALALLPLALLFLLLAIRQRKRIYHAGAILTIALMALTSAFGLIDATIGIVCLIAALPRQDRKRNLFVAAGIGAWAYAVASPFQSPSLIVAIRKAASYTGEGWKPGSFTALAIVLLGCVILDHFLGEKTDNRPLYFFALFAWIVFCIPVLAQYLNRAFLPQPGRYKLEMDAGLDLLLVFSLGRWFLRMPGGLKGAVLFLLLALAGEQVVGHRMFAKAILRPTDPSKSIEYRAATWADQNLPGERVMFPGSVAMWANAFSGVQQFTGGSWSMAMNVVQQMGRDAVYREDARTALAWLKAYGVGAVAISAPNSEEIWKGFTHPSEFEGVLPAIWSEGGVTLYRISGANASLAHMVPPGAIVVLAPRGTRDIEQIERYVAALEDPSAQPATFEWQEPGRIQIRANVPAGDVLSIQVSYRSGWHAQAAGRAIRIRKDGLGLMWLEPGCTGPCEIDLAYTGGFEFIALRFLSLGAILAIPLWLFAPAIRRKSQKRGRLT